MREDGNERNRRCWWRLFCWMVGIGAVAAVLVGIYRMNPDPGPDEGAFDICGFNRVTGLACPGCGATRATHHLMHGELERAFAMNPAFVGGLPFGLVGVAVLMAARWRGARVPAAGVWGFWLTLLVLVLAYWVVRNQVWWPWPLP